MPDSPASVLAEPSAGSPPDAPPSVLAEASAGGSPTAPPSVLAEASGGGSPTAPPSVLAEASGGGAPTAPTSVLAEPGATKAVMRVTGTLTSDGSEPLVFPEMLFDPSEIEMETWKDVENLGVSPDYAVYGEPGDWNLFSIGSPRFNSTDNVSSPDLVTTWTPVGSATGTPVVTSGTAPTPVSVLA